MYMADIAADWGNLKDIFCSSVISVLGSKCRAAWKRHHSNINEMSVTSTEFSHFFRVMTTRYINPPAKLSDEGYLPGNRPEC